MKKKLRIFRLPGRRNEGVLMIVFLLAGLNAFTLQASDSSTRKITLMKENVSVIVVFSEIEKQSGYKFFYNDNQIDATQKVSLRLEKATLKTALDILFKDTDIRYKLVDDYIVLTSRKASSDISPLGVGPMPTNDLLGSNRTPEFKPILRPKSKGIAVLQITGKVKDDAGQSLPGVNVLVKGTTNGTTSDADGAYSLEVADASATIIFSFIGFLTQEVPLNGRTVLDVTMVPDVQTLSEVVVVGYGEQKKATLSGAVAVVSGAEVMTSPATNLSNTLAGRMPGLFVITRSSEPGADDAILRVRGVSTFGNNNPLVVVDGIPNRSLSRIDPSTVESISVLKDASAAIYGAQAANGVILITTKKGKVGKPTVTASFNQGYGRPTQTPEMANATQYATMLNEISIDNGNAPVYTDQELEKFSTGEDPWRYPNTDWFKEVLRPWSGQNYFNLSIGGGSESMRYFIAGSRRAQEGFYYNSGTKYNQYDFRTNLDGDIGKYISIGLGLLGRYEDRNFPSRSVNDIFRSIARGKPNLPAYWPNGLPGPDIEYGDNPVVISTKATGYDQAETLVLNTNFKLNIKIPWVKGLSVTGNAAIDEGFVFRKIWNTPWYLYTWDGSTLDSNGEPVLLKSKKGFDAPRLEERNGHGGNTLINGLINYQTTIADAHNLTLLVGVEKITGDTLSSNASRRNFVSPSVDQLFAGAQDAFLSNNGTASSRARLNYFGRVNYTFKDKFLAEFVWRYQGSYIFEESSRYGFFPGVSLGYVISQENFWKSNLAFVDYFKIRASWGQTGNDLIAPYQYLTVFKSPTFLNSPTGSQLAFNDGEKLNLALIEDVLANQNTSWEVATQRNIGFDADLLDSKISITADYFSNLRDDILWQRNASVPSSAGVTLPRENIGKTENKGFDFSINYRNTAGKFSYQVGLNGGYAKNKIVFWDEAPGDPDYKRSTGKPIGANSYYQAIGIFQTADEVNNYPHFNGARPGDIIFADVNGDLVIDANDQVRSNKTNIPKWTGGLTLGLKYGGFDLSVLVYGASGAETYVLTESGTIGNYLKSFVDSHWSTENPSTTNPRAFERQNQYWASQLNTHWLRSTDYIRLKNIELGYAIPSNIIGKVKMQNARIYVNAFNFLTYSPDMKDFDPEMTQNPGSAGNTYPIQKIINVGVSLTF